MQEMIVAILEESLNQNKGVTLFFDGQSIPIVVTALIGTEAVLGKNREYNEILIRLDRVTAYAA